MVECNTGTSVRQLRVRLRMTQEEFAHALGITVSTVNRWENGHSEPSKLARASLAGLAEKHGVTIDVETLAITPSGESASAPVLTAQTFEAYAR